MPEARHRKSPPLYIDTEARLDSGVLTLLLGVEAVTTTDVTSEKFRFLVWIMVVRESWDDEDGT